MGDTNIIGDFELYLYDGNSGMTTQITNDPTGVAIDPSINSDGTRIAYASNVDLNDGNSDKSFELFLYDTDSMVLTQITRNNQNEEFFSTNPSINSDGTRIAFSSSSDLIGDNPDGNLEIFLYDVNSTSITQITSEVTGSSTSTVGESINKDGTLIVFHSNANINRGNPDGNIELFLADCSNSDLFLDISGTSVRDDNIEYNYSIANSGPQDATGVELVDILPPNAEFVSAESSQGTCQPTEASATTSEIIARQTGRTVHCDIGTLAVGDTVEVEIVITTIDTDQIENTAEVNSDIPDPNTDNNSVTTTIVVEPPTRNNGGCALTGVSEARNELLDFIFLLLPLLFIGVRVMKTIVTKVHS